jgi:hypothetical protein
MAKRSGMLRICTALALLALAVPAPPAHAQNFFSALFGGFGRFRGPTMRMPGDGGNFGQFDPRSRYGGGLAHCVRTCDGRHFPVTGNGNQSRAEMCKNFCPASETKVVYGGSIDNAATEDGKAYSELPNAFRYRNELVAGCTCNGKDPTGLASVSIDKDPTLRRGDIVAGENGLAVAGRGADRRGAELNFSPASERVRARYQRMPVVARE